MPLANQFGGQPFTFNQQIKEQGNDVATFADIKTVLSSLVIPVNTSDPYSPVEGQIYYNSIELLLKIWLDNKWQFIALA